MIFRILALLFSVGLAAQEYGYRQYSTAAGLPDARVERVVADSLGYVYALTPLGWVRFDGERFTDIDQPPAGVRDDTWLSERELETIRYRYLEGSPFANTELLDLTEDLQGYRWLATGNQGLLRQLPSSFVTYPVEGAAVTAIGTYRDTLYIGTDGRGLYRLVNDTLQPVDIGAELEGLRITALAGSADHLFLGTAGRGVFVVNPDTLVQIRQRNGLPSNWIRQLVAGDSILRVLTVAGELAEVVVRDSSVAVRRDSVSTEGSTRYSQLLNGPNDVPLLIQADPAVVRQLLEPGFLISGIPAITGASLRRTTQLWLSAEDRGVYFTDLEASPFRFGRVDERLFGDAGAFQCILALGEQREVWVGIDRGVSRLSLDQNGQPLYARQYGSGEGFPVAGAGPAVIFADPAGRVWFGTQAGLVRFVGRGREAFRQPPPTTLEGITLFYDTITAGKSEFQARENHLGFRFRAVDLTYPERVRYRYRLSPLEPDWSPETRENAVSYAGLPGGTYTFSVAASTDGNTWGPPATYAFTIESPLLLQPAVLIAGVLLLSGILVLGFYVYHRRLLKQQLAIRDGLQRQNDLLRLEQQARQLQMNPHFLFNALNGIRGLVDRTEAREQLSRFAALMRGILHNSRQETITLAEELATLEQYLKMEQFCQPRPFTYRIETAEGLDPEEVALPPMLLQPFVENAILHGFGGLDREGSLLLRFFLRGRRCHVEIQDNGVGRHAAEKRRETRSPGHKSVAVGITRDRILAMGGRLTITDAVPHGTQVQLEIPVFYAW
ncbi:YXYXY domain-containing protein [Neolewinella xylanilytica]|uniref:YXYXY domain-containing protein n=1 Tax=Neolewinella xylanilytica TaxID=1514080 RepID=A0A2S6IB22_9BACT|nr:sensor histidine kinase [Neolewinella xylanilytica]PPK88666.1 YXYXY domain-containing protein [Neolewinella xylanilytica]